MITYRVEIQASESLSGGYTVERVVIHSKHCLPTNTLRKMAIHRVGGKYTTFGSMKIEIDLDKPSDTCENGNESTANKLE